MKFVLVLVVLLPAFLFLAFLAMVIREPGGLKKYLKAAPAPVDPHRGDEVETVAARPPAVSVAAPVEVVGARGAEGLGYEDAAYWATVKDLTAVGGMPAGLLEEIRPVVLRAATMGNEQAGRVVCEALSGVEWGWLAWPAYAEQAGCSTLDGIAAEVAALTVEDRLGLLTRQELVDLSRQAGVKVKARDSRSTMIAALLAGVDKGKLVSLTDPAMDEHRAALREGCLQEMASHLVFRVSRQAHCLERYEQLADTGLQALLPNWKFVCQEEAPPRCRNFDGMILPAREAMKTFPQLPCDNLGCRCRITAVGESKGE